MKQELSGKLKSPLIKIISNPRLINIRSFLAKDGFTKFFHRDYKFWSDFHYLNEIKSEFFYNELKLKLLEIHFPLSPSLSETIDIIRRKFEINYLEDLSKNEFRMFQFLRDNGRIDNNLGELIISNREITKFSEMLLTSDRVAAIGLIDDLESKLINFIYLSLNLKSYSYKIENNIWKPLEIEAKKILESKNVDGYNYSILSNALKHLNFCSSVLLDYNAILYLRKTNLVIAIAPKYKV